MRLSGIGSEQAIVEGPRAAAASVGSENEAAVCGPGCNCGTSSRGRSIKAVVSLIVALAVVGMLAYKALRNPPNVVAGTDGSAFAVAQGAPLAGSEVGSQSSSLAKRNEAAKAALPDEKPTTENAPAPARTDQKIGEYLESLNALNNVAVNQDVVFIFVPAEKSELADDKRSKDPEAGAGGHRLGKADVQAPRRSVTVVSTVWRGAFEEGSSRNSAGRNELPVSTRGGRVARRAPAVRCRQHSGSRNRRRRGPAGHSPGRRLVLGLANTSFQDAMLAANL